MSMMLQLHSLRPSFPLYRPLQTWLKKGWNQAKYEVAKVYRLALGRVCFVGVTGSCGKTTTKELLGAILASRYDGSVSHQLYNGPNHVTDSIFTIRPWHQFCVHEIGSSRPGYMARSMKVFRPRIGVVTHIGDDHRASFRTLEATAHEKGKLVECLPAYGSAVFNADDPRVLAMRQRTQARVITYGLSPEAMVRGEEVSGAWPERLSLTVVFGTERVRIKTRLVGEHWTHSVLAALAAAMAFGIPLQHGARIVETVEPVEGRMSPYTTAHGITFIQDDWKAPLWTIPASLKFLQTARAARKLVIIGTISDYSGKASRRYPAVARKALAIADKVIFVGPLAHCALKARTDDNEERLLAFDKLYDLRDFLRDYLHSGDLVLLKGSRHTDHLERIILDRSEGIACWRVSCGRGFHCRQCPLRQSSFVSLPAYLGGAA